jgi:hypothetical protein
MNQLPVKEIRSNQLKITNEPIVYFWWFKTVFTLKLLSKLNDELNFEKIKTKEINGLDYSLLYIGQAKKGYDRLVKYHMLDTNNFHSKGVENGRLSSLRTTLCGLLDLPMSQSKKEIDDVMDNNCIVEWDNCNLEELDKYEQHNIKSNYTPLNYQHTKDILTKNHRKILSQSKRAMRK